MLCFFGLNSNVIAQEVCQDVQGEYNAYKGWEGFAVKTNLLYDFVSALNVELEYPLTGSWSVTGEWLFPWWLSRDNSKAFQVLSLSLEARYWFDIYARGCFLTAYTSGGLYDFGWNSKGYQGEFYIAFGLGLGYVHSLNKEGSLGLEYYVGLGYLRTNYRHYNVVGEEYLVLDYTGKFSWLGPTKVKVSLVWYLFK